MASDDASLLLETVNAILESAGFRRAPILSRLLRFLLDKTLSGEAERLKAYTVAVDGLGRAADFDSQLDSYPRVQIVRLRKALETYYAEDVSGAGPCVFLGAGSYRLRLGDRATVYPSLARREDAPQPVILDAPPTVLSRWHVSGRRFWAGLAISIALVAVMGLAITASREAATARLVSHNSYSAPMPVPIAALDLGNSSTASPQARAVAAIMSDGLRRSWVARIRDGTVATPGVVAPPAYSIMLRERDMGNFDIKLVDARSNTILWTQSAGQLNDAELRERLAPIIAMISGPYGVIARAETSRLRDTTIGSYACVLRYFAFVRARQPEEKARVTTCLDQPVDDPQLEPTVGAVRAFFTLESRVWPDRAAQLATAEQFARGAAQHNADDPYAQYAMSRLAYIQGQCPAARSHSDRAVVANPYDSVIVTVLAGLAAQCDNPGAGPLLDRAYRIRNDNDTAMRGFLVLATLAQKQEERLSELGFLLRPPPGPQLGGYLLTETLMAAAQGRNSEAASRWSEFRKFYQDAGPSDDDKLKMMILSDPMRHRVLEMLRNRGVIRS